MLIKDGLCTGIGEPAVLLDKHTLTEHFGLTEELYNKYL